MIGCDDVNHLMASSLKQHSWPGNIRELKNVLARAVILTKGSRLRLHLALQSEKTNMITALRHANWHVWGPDGASELMGVKPSTFAYRMKVLGIEKK